MNVDLGIDGISLSPNGLYVVGNGLILEVLDAASGDSCLICCNVLCFLGTGMQCFSAALLYLDGLG